MFESLSRSMFERTSSRQRRLAERRRSTSLRPMVEGLEDRVVLSTIVWNTAVAPSGGDWDTDGNWVGNSKPKSGDTAQINLTSAGTVTHLTGVSDSVLNVSTNALTTLSVDSGTLTLGAAPSQVNGPVTVGFSGTLQLINTTLFGQGTLTVGGQMKAHTGAALLLSSTTINTGATLTVGNFSIGTSATLTFQQYANMFVTVGSTVGLNGTTSFATGDTVTIATDFSNRITQVLVSSSSTGGSLSAVGTTFTGTGGYTTNLLIGAAGHFTAASCTFALSELYLDDGSVYGAGDLTGNNFGMPILVPYNDVKNLANNARFTDININPGTISSGTLALNAIGTNTASLRYVFPAGFTVATGGTLSVGPNVPVLLSPGQTLTVNGTASFATGDAVTLATDFNNRTAQILVSSNSTGGTLSAVGTTFTGTGGYTTSISVGAAGHFTAANSTFSLSSLSLDDSSVYGAGDLTGDNFGMPIYVPYNDVKNLANNAKFTDININAGTISSGTLALNLIGINTANLRYVFPNGFTVGTGGTMNVAANVSVLVPFGQALTVNGTASFATGDTVTLATDFNNRTAQILVSSN
ncbi:MAG: putative autotransporter protein, partial [Planctomycetota bacterium]|nr:putative autotransporter protein [Planctomycetota bacterium]